MGNLLFGFIARVNASQGQHVVAGICILFAALLDGFDGQIARMRHVTSKVGEQLDALADCVTFGIAPGYLAYSAYLSQAAFPLNETKYIPLRMFIAAAFPLCADYRLARFNVSHESGSFSGLPTTIAGLVMAFVPVAFSNPKDIRSRLPEQIERRSGERHQGVRSLHYRFLERPMDLLLHPDASPGIDQLIIMLIIIVFHPYL